MDFLWFENDLNLKRASENDKILNSCLFLLFFVLWCMEVWVKKECIFLMWLFYYSFDCTDSDKSLKPDFSNPLSPNKSLLNYHYLTNILETLFALPWNSIKAVSSELKQNISRYKVLKKIRNCSKVCENPIVHSLQF